MYTFLNTVTLKSGEVVEAGVVAGPDEQWRERVQQLLIHKGEPWDWQNTELLTHEVGVEAFFHLLHRDGVPFCNIMTVERYGVGIFGHVWTSPEERGQGAASQLMALQMEYFSSRGGRALYLGTAYDSSAYHIYRRHGFVSNEPLSGNMSFFSNSREEFEAEYFAPGVTEIQPLDWPHWPASAALFTADLPGVIRCAPLRLFRRALTEGPLLPPIRERYIKPQTGDVSRTYALCKPANGAVVGLATWSEDPLWPDTYLCDVYCHPNFWEHAGDLLAKLVPPDNSRLLAYSDTQTKAGVLQAAGFQAVATLPNWMSTDTFKTTSVDVTLFQKL